MSCTLLCLWVQSISRDLWYLIRIVYWSICNKFDFTRPILFNADSKAYPIILVHGSNGNQTEWYSCEKYFKKYFSNNPVYAFSLDLAFNKYTGEQLFDKGCCCDNLTVKNISSSHDWSINTYAYNLSDRINWVLEKHHTNNYAMIGHSMGGLVLTRYYSSLRPEFRKNVIFMASISSPMNGAGLLSPKCMPKLLNKKRYYEMSPNSDFIININNTLVSKFSPLYTFGSNQDTHVSDKDSNAICSDHHTTVNGYGHISIVECERIWATIHRKTTLSDYIIVSR